MTWGDLISCCGAPSDRCQGCEVHTLPSPVESSSTAETARRVQLWHNSAALADSLLRAEDTLPHLDDHERAVRLSALAGDVSSDVWLNSSADLDTALLRLHAEVALWIESRMREQAAR